eukprot:PLAT4369.1.p2 GENE.PLAT4369.1~~PLAT4369.1.p2  ORF type:complete len:452 (+),score=214.64 PLAT4369.1:97-1452(+)
MALAFQSELALLALLLAVWAGEKSMAALRASPLLGQILAGLLLGPALADIVPFPEALQLVGKFGVLLLVVDSGLQVQLAEVRRVGLRAAAAAATGVALPTLAAALLLPVLWPATVGWQAALAAGAALAPTSLGFSAQLLSEVGQLTTASGQFVCTAAVVDDVLSLLLLAEIQALALPDDGGWRLVRPLLGGCGSLCIGVLLAVVAPPYVQRLLARVQTEEARSRALLLALAALAALFGFLCAAVGSSDLLGTFLAALMFSSLPGATDIWQRQMKRFTRWGSALFFAATIGFSVPSLLSSGGLFDALALLQGAFLLVIALCGKLALGLFAKPLRWDSAMKLGWAMNGRGEFSFLISAQALAEGIMSPTLASAVTWALLLSSALAPCGFRHYLNKQVVQQDNKSSKKTDDDAEESKADGDEEESKADDEQNKEGVAEGVEMVEKKRKAVMLHV